MDLNAWLEANKPTLNLLYTIVQVCSAVAFAWCVRYLLRSTWQQAEAMHAVFRDARMNLINATTRGLEERLSALEKIVMEDHLQRIERAARPESEGR